jgi:hypothetical protein
MKVLIHNGKHCQTAFPETDAGWIMFFKHMENDEGYYHGIATGVDVREAKINLKEVEDLNKGKEKLPRLLQAEAEQNLVRLPRYKKELHDAERQQVLYKQARRGDAKAAKDLAYARHDYEYEDFEILEVRES